MSACVCARHVPGSSICGACTVVDSMAVRGARMGVATKADADGSSSERANRAMIMTEMQFGG